MARPAGAESDDDFCDEDGFFIDDYVSNKVKYDEVSNKSIFSEKQSSKVVQSWEIENGLFQKD